MFPPPPGQQPPRPPRPGADAEPRDAPTLANMNLTAAAAARKTVSRRESTTPKSLRWRAAAASLCLLAYAPVALYSAWIAVAFLSNRDQASNAELDRVTLVADVYGGFFLLGVISICLWLWKMVKAVRRLGATNEASSPNTAVAYFFVPPFCFWKPYLIVRAVWQSAIDPRDADNIPVSQILPLWWTAWLTQWVTLIMFFIFEYVMLGVPQKPMLEIIDVWIFFACSTVAALCLVVIIIQSTRNLNHYLRSD